VIRRATAADAPALAALHVRSFHHAYPDIVPAEILAAVTVEEFVEKWERWLGPEALGPTFVAETDERIFGLCALERARVRNLHVEPAAQGAGLGSALLTHAEAALREADFAHGELLVFAANGLARTFYERHDWTTGGVVVEDPSGWAPAVRYVKQL